MSDKAKIPARFGVASLVEEAAEIYYSNDIRARAIGRVSDLIGAKLRGFEVDEVRLRTLLGLGAYQVYAISDREPRHHEEVPPTSIEVGIGEEFVAVAFSYHWFSDRTPAWEGMAERIDAGRGEGELEKNLEGMLPFCDRLLVRYAHEERRIEVTAFCRRDHEQERESTVVMEADSASSDDLESSRYTELGDLDFTRLLAKPDTDAHSSVVGGGAPLPAEEISNFTGDADHREEVREFSATAGEADSEIRFAADSDSDSIRAVRDEYEATIAELRNTVRTLSERMEAPIIVKGTPPVTEDEDGGWGLQFLKQVWPFAAKADESTVTEVAESPDRKAIGESESVIIPAGESGKPSESESAIVATRALAELQDLAKPKSSAVVEATLKEIEAQADPGKAKRWVDSLSSELLQERAKLNELQKQLAGQMRQRELEFKTAELALKQELKRKEEQINQRQASIENKNDQIAQLNLAVERASVASNDKESQQIKVKLERAQRLAQMKEEEAKALIAKVRDLENRLIIAQAKAQKGNDFQAAGKVQNLEKKVEEYRRINQRLMESLNSQKEKSNDKEVGDLRRKIEQLDRAVIESKRNLDKSTFRMRELQESERKLQADLARAIDENRNLRKGSERGSNESGGQAA